MRTTSHRCTNIVVSALLVALLAASGCWSPNFWPFSKKSSDEGALIDTSNHAKIAQPPSRGVQVKAPPAPPRLLAFDFGTAVAWEGFLPVPGAKSVSLSPGVQFGTDDTHAKDFPDPLVGDYAASDEFTVTISGLQKGVYRAAIIAQNVGAGLVPAKPFQIAANGKTVISVDVAPDWYFSDKGFFYGVQFDDTPSSPYWDRYVEPVAPWRSFEFNSTGELVLTLTNCRLYGLVIAPEDDVTDSEFNTFIESTEAARKAYFLFNQFRFTEAPPSGKTAGEKRFLERGYAVFSRGWGEDVTYNTIPKTAEITNALDAAGTPGERVPVTFAVRTFRSLQEVNVTVSDLSAPGGKTIPSQAVTVQSVRYMMRRDDKGLYTIVPDAIEDQTGVNVPGNMTKRWWLTVTIPNGTEAGTYTGQIRFSPNGAPGAILTLTLEVYPFTLAKPASSFGVWYADPQDAGYRTGIVGGVNSVKPGEDKSSRNTERDIKVESYRVAMLDADLKSLAEHGFTGLTVPTPRVVSINADGRVKLDFGAVDAYPPLLKKYGIDVDFPGQTYLLDIARQIVRVGLNGTPIEEYSAIHQKAYKDAVTQIRDYWKDAGVKMLAYAVDEPREKDINPWNRNLRDTLSYLNLIREVDDFPSTVTTMRDEQDRVSYMPIYQAEDVIQPQPSVLCSEAADYAKKAGKPLRFYNGGWSRYAFGFYTWAKKPEAYFQWHFDMRDLSFNPFYESDDGYVVFPSPNGPISTVKYERAAQGIYDCRYAQTLSDYVARAKASYNPEAISTAREGQAVLDDIRKGVKPWLLDKKSRPLTVPNDTLSQWRAKIAAHIIAIQKALE